MKEAVKTITAKALGAIGFIGLFVEAEPLPKIASLAISVALIGVSIWILKGTELWNKTSEEA